MFGFLRNALKNSIVSPRDIADDPVSWLWFDRDDHMETTNRPSRPDRLEILWNGWGDRYDPDDHMETRLKQIHKFSFKDVIFLTKEYKMYLKTFQKLGCLVAFQNRPSAPIGCEENFVNFEILGGQFCKEKPSFVHWKKTKHSFELSLPFSVSFSGVFLALTWETLVFSCKPPPEIGAVSLLSHFWGFFSRPHSFVWTTWPEPLRLRGVMRPRD